MLLKSSMYLSTTFTDGRFHAREDQEQDARSMTLGWKELSPSGFRGSKPNMELFLKERIFVKKL